MRFQAILLFFLLFIIGNAIANSDFYYKIGSEIDLKVPCVEDNGKICNSSASCNITIINDLTGDKAVENEEMSYNNDGIFNYTLNDSSLIGDYSGYTYCILGSEYGAGSFKFTINNIGNNNDNIMYITLIIMSVFIALSIILTIFFYTNQSPMMYLFLILTFLFSTLLCYFTYLFPMGIIADVADLFLMLAIVFGIITFIIIIMVLSELTLTLLSMWRRKKQEEWIF